MFAGLVGMIMIETPALNLLNNGFENWTISFCISELFEGKGIMSMALTNVLYFLKFELSVKEIFAVTEIENSRSINIMKKIGFVVIDNSNFNWDTKYSKSKPIVFIINLLNLQ